MCLRLTVSQSLLALLLAWSPATLAAEPMSNNSMSETFVTEVASPTSACKPSTAPSAGPVTTGGTPCPVMNNATPLMNPAQDAVVRQTLAQDSPHAAIIDNSPAATAQLLQNIENTIVGNATASASGGIIYTSYGIGQSGNGAMGGGRIR